MTDVKDVDFLVRVDGDPSKDDDPKPRLVLTALRSALTGLPEVLAKDGYITTHGGKVKFLGRLLKHWRNVQMKTRRPKSYWLGALLVHHMRRDNGLDMSKSVAELFHDLLTAIYNQYASTLARDDDATPNIKDPMLGHNVSWNWGRPAFETFMHRLEDGIEWTDKALAAEKQEDAIYWWQRVFGEDYFPSDVSEAARRQANLAYPGRSSVAASGLILSAGSATRTATPSQPTRFHGSHGQKIQ